MTFTPEAVLAQAVLERLNSRSSMSYSRDPHKTNAAMLDAYAERLGQTCETCKFAGKESEAGRYCTLPKTIVSYFPAGIVPILTSTGAPHGCASHQPVEQAKETT